MESIQDLLAPEKTNIPIVEDAKTGEVSVPGAEIVKIRKLEHFLQLMQLGEANRHAANTKMNTESSRSHAILMVQDNIVSNILTGFLYSTLFCKLVHPLSIHFTIILCRYISVDLQMRTKKLTKKQVWQQVDKAIMC